MNRHTGASDPLVKLAQDIDQVIECADRMAPGRDCDAMLATMQRKVRVFESAEPPRQIAALQSAGIWAP